MPTHILKCPKCSTYTLSDTCPKCRTSALPPIPAKYSPEDQYGKYRREAKKDALKEKGII